METPPVGSLVVPSPRYRATLDLGEGAAVLMALRRGSGRLYYAAEDRSFWIPTQAVRAIPLEAVPAGCLERFLTDLLGFLAAEEASIDARDGPALTLSVETAGTSRAHLAELSALLGPRLVDYRILPGSMRALLVELDLTALPDAAGAGT